jgi:hypothetical protein
MPPDLVPEITTALEGIAQQEILWHEDHVVERIHALDELERHVLERIENTLYVQGYRQELARLYHRATQLRERLASVNAQLFHRLQGQLSTSTATGTHLQQLCETYVSHTGAVPKRQGSDEDYLDVFINGVLGVEQMPAETLELQPGMIGYVPTPTRVIFALLEHVSLSADDVFYDVGSGLGRVPLLVGLLTAAQAKGIEIEPAYCAYAQERARSLHLTQVTFINRDACHAGYADGTVFFLYTPCTGHMFQAVLDRVHEETCTRPITIAAYGLCTTYVAQQSWLQPVVHQAFDHDILAIFTSRNA